MFGDGGLAHDEGLGEEALLAGNAFCPDSGKLGKRAQRGRKMVIQPVRDSARGICARVLVPGKNFTMGTEFRGAPGNKFISS